MTKEVMMVTILKEANFLDSLLAKSQLSKAVRDFAWVRRFIHNFGKARNLTI